MGVDQTGHGQAAPAIEAEAGGNLGGVSSPQADDEAVFYGKPACRNESGLMGKGKKGYSSNENIGR
jgi:hypothetical protein